MHFRRSHIAPADHAIVKQIAANPNSSSHSIAHLLVEYLLECRVAV